MPERHGHISHDESFPTKLIDLVRICLNGAVFDDAHPTEVLRWAGEVDRLVVTAGFGDAVLVHLVSQAIPDADIVLLDTGYLFAETESFAEHLRQRYRLNLRTVRPAGGRARPVAHRHRRLLPRPQGQPIRTACSPPRRPGSPVSSRSDSPCASKTPVVPVDAAPPVTKINPSPRGPTTTSPGAEAMELLPEHPLADRGYPSIGCWPCTRPVADGDNPRSVARAGSDENECGLHVSGVDVPVSVSGGGAS